MDVAETDKVIEITAELPGLEKKDVELNVTDNLLTIRGEKRSEREEKNKDYPLVERSFGSFPRSVELPEGVKPEDITAEIAQGCAEGDRAEAGSQAIQADRHQDGSLKRNGVLREVVRHTARYREGIAPVNGWILL